MKRFAVCLLALALPASIARADPPRTEYISYDRTSHAIHELENLIAYLEANPYYFDGYKIAAISSARSTVDRLRAAMPLPGSTMRPSDSQIRQAHKTH